jgi:hypothetical protein
MAKDKDISTDVCSGQKGLVDPEGLVREASSKGDTNVLQDFKTYLTKDNAAARFIRYNMTPTGRYKQVREAEIKKFGMTLEAQLRQFPNRDINPNSSDPLNVFVNLKAREEILKNLVKKKAEAAQGNAIEAAQGNAIAVSSEINKVNEKSIERVRTIYNDANIENIRNMYNDNKIIDDAKKKYDAAKKILENKNINIDSLTTEYAEKEIDKRRINDPIRCSLIAGLTSKLNDRSVRRAIGHVFDYFVLQEQLKLEQYRIESASQAFGDKVQRLKERVDRFEEKYKKVKKAETEGQLRFLDQELKDPDGKRAALSFKLELYKGEKRYYEYRSAYEKLERKKPLHELNARQSVLELEKKRIIGDNTDNVNAEIDKLKESRVANVNAEINKLEESRAAKEALARFDISPQGNNALFEEYKALLDKHQTHETDKTSKLDELNQCITTAKEALDNFDK